MNIVLNYFLENLHIYLSYSKILFNLFYISQYEFYILYYYILKFNYIYIYCDEIKTIK